MSNNIFDLIKNIFDFINDPDYETLDLPPTVSKTLGGIHKTIVTIFFVPISFSFSAVGLLMLTTAIAFLMSLVSEVLTPADWGRPFWEVVWLTIKWPYIIGVAIMAIGMAIGWLSKLWEWFRNKLTLAFRSFLERFREF